MAQPPQSQYGRPGPSQYGYPGAAPAGYPPAQADPRYFTPRPQGMNRANVPHRFPANL